MSAKLTDNERFALNQARTNGNWFDPQKRDAKSACLTLYECGLLERRTIQWRPRFGGPDHYEWEYRITDAGRQALEGNDG